MGEEELPNQETQSADNDPLYISDDEAEQIQRLVDNGGTGYFQAVERVFNNSARYGRYMDARGVQDASPAEESPVSTSPSTSPRPAKRAYRARYQDSTDYSVEAFKKGTEEQTEDSEG